MAIGTFIPSGTSKLIAASSSTAGAEVTQVCTGNEQAMYIANASTVPIYVAPGSSSVQATVPTTLAPARGQCIPNGAPPLYISTPPAGWLSVVTSAGSANVFATPGFAGS